MNKKVLFLVHAAVIAALYVVLTYIASALNLSSGVIQVRISEALCILPYFTPAAIPGLFIGCLLSNLLTGCVVWDVVFGSLATLLGALGTWMLTGSFRRKKEATPRNLSKWLAPLPPIAANTLIVPFILRFAYQFPGSIPYFMLTVGIGEILSCGVLGLLLLNVLNKYRQFLFPSD